MLPTSNVAEANVESQINARFKRKQKMQWNRENQDKPPIGGSFKEDTLER